MVYFIYREMIQVNHGSQKMRNFLLVILTIHSMAIAHGNHEHPEHNRIKGCYYNRCAVALMLE